MNEIKTEKWSIQLSKQYKDILKKYCKENGLNMSGYIEKLIDKNIPKKIILNDEDFWKSFEPKTTQRFIVYVKNEHGETIIPSYVIKYIERPTYSLNSGEWIPNILKMKCYDPISPSIPQAIYNSIDKKEKWNLIINILGPVGDKVEEWEIKNATIDSVLFGNLNWCEINNPIEIEIFLNVNNIKLNY